MRKLSQHGFDWIDACNFEEVPIEDCQKFPIIGKPHMFYGVSRNYVYITLIPVIGLSVSKLLSVDLRKIDVDAVLFVGVVLALFFAVIFFISRRRVKHFTYLKKKNVGREVFKTGGRIFISAGELIRGEANSKAFFLNGLADELLKTKEEYLSLPFDECATVDLTRHVLTLKPHNSLKKEFVITIGDFRQDREMLDKLKTSLENIASRQ